MNTEKPDVFLRNKQSNNEITKTEEDVLELKKKKVDELYQQLGSSDNTDNAYVRALEEMRKRSLSVLDDKVAPVVKLEESPKKSKQIQKEKIVEKPIIKTSEIKSNNSDMDDIKELGMPHYNSAYDVIELPSMGINRKNKKSNVKVSYLTTSDENILTSPNLLQSGKFLEVLLNRKVLEEDLRYKDLLVGDRNAIMLWLRATGYGEMYPVTILDEDGVPFDTEIDLSKLKTKKLSIKPDDEGLFSYTLPLAKKLVKFKFLTVGEIEEIEKILDDEKENGVVVNNSNLYLLSKMVVEVDGNRDVEYIKEYIESLRLMDGKSLKKYIDEIEPGIDLNIEVETPGGESVKTFLPLNIKFFWPDFGL